jgi:aspartate/methionine/tyrosine aminotransferase
MGEELSRIPGLPVTVPDGAFYYFVDVRRFGSSLDIAARVLAERKVIMIPGEAFGPGGGGFIRVSYAAATTTSVEVWPRSGRSWRPVARARSPSELRQPRPRRVRRLPFRC